MEKTCKLRLKTFYQNHILNYWLPQKINDKQIDQTDTRERDYFQITPPPNPNKYIRALQKALFSFATKPIAYFPQGTTIIDHNLRSHSELLNQVNEFE